MPVTRNAMMPGRRMPLAIALLLIATVVCAYRVVPYTPAYRNYQFAHMSLDEQWRMQRNYINDPIFLYFLGLKLNRRGQFSTADPYLERAAGLDPDSASIRDEWVKALMGHGRVSVAFGILQQYMASHPHAPEPPLLLGKYYVSRQDWNPAGRVLETAVRLAPQNAEAWSLLAHVRIKMGQYANAETALAKAIALNPGDADNHLQLAVLVGSGDSARARREYVRAVELAPKDPICLRQYGRFLLDSGDPTGAEREAYAAIAQNAQDPLAQLLLGRALMAQNKWQESIAPLEEAACRAPTDPQPAEQLRRAYRQSGRPDMAAQWDTRYLALTHGQEERQRLLDATQAHPKDPATHHRLAAALAAIDDVNGCVREEAFAAKTTPDNARTLTAAARDLDRAGYAAEALPLARQAATQRLNPTAQEMLADVLLHLGRLHEAAIHYEQIRDWKPEKVAQYKRQLVEAAERIHRSQAPAEQLIRAAQTEPDRDKAEAMLKQALAIEPDNTRAMRALLRRQFAHGAMEQAATTALNLSALSPEDGVAHTYYVAARLALLGNKPLSKDADQDFDRHLQAATKDTTAAPIFYYDQGLIALKHGQAKDAVNYLNAARQLDPTALAIYEPLAEASTLAGDTNAAQQARTELDRRQQERLLLARIADQHATGADYQAVIAYYQAAHRPKQAQEMRAEAKRRFGMEY